MSIVKPKHVTVIGAGLMGSGIVQICSQAGYSAALITGNLMLNDRYLVTMCDTNESQLENGKKIIQKSISRIAKKKYSDDLNGMKEFLERVDQNISTSTKVDQVVKDTDLVIEAIVENLKVKQSLFQSLDKIAKKSCIFASNTSSLPIADIAKTSLRKSHFAGLHFFNPVPQMKLVEIVKTKDTSEEVFKVLHQFCKDIGKTPVTCKDTPGLLVPYMMEAIRMVERGSVGLILGTSLNFIQGDATKEDVDIAMKLGAGYPMGPFELADYVGLDTTKFITDGWYTNGQGLKGDKLIAPSKLLNDLVEKKMLGRKNGKGFYDYSKL